MSDVVGFDEVFRGQPEARAKAAAWAAGQGFTSLAEILECGEGMVDAMVASTGAAPGIVALLGKRAREWAAPDDSEPDPTPSKRVKTEAAAPPPPSPAARPEPDVFGARPAPPPPTSSLVVEGKGSAHPKIFVVKKQTFEENKAAIEAAILDGRTSLDHALAKTKPGSGTLRSVWSCHKDNDPPTAAQVDKLYDFLVAWKMSLRPGWDPNAKPAASPAKEFNSMPPILEAAKTGRSSCKQCGEKIDAGELRVGLPAFIRGSVTTAWTKAECFKGAVMVEIAPDNRSKCKASGEKIVKNEDLRVVAYVGPVSDPKSKVNYKPAFIADFLEDWMAEVSIEPSDVRGFNKLDADKQAEFIGLFEETMGER
mmetsp:Transcript_2808/g.8294  ORF Transcript_2808/g.8294 Transcript_2808/m.8294 type:complete len:367 (+) Transcript_2808:696-1796(+)